MVVLLKSKSILTTRPTLPSGDFIVYIKSSINVILGGTLNKVNQEGCWDTLNTIILEVKSSVTPSPFTEQVPGVVYLRQTEEVS